MLDKCWTKIVKYLWYKFYVIELNSFNISICRASLACCCLVWHLKNVYTYSGLNSSIIEALFLSLFMGSTPLLVLDLGMTWLEFFDSFVGHSVERLLGRLWNWSDWSILSQSSFICLTWPFLNPFHCLLSILFIMSYLA